MGKFREFWIGFPKNPYSNRKIVYTSPTEHQLLPYDKYEGSLPVIEKAAFTEAVALIDELEKLIDRYNRALPHGWDKPALAKALEKIKEFKEKGER